MDENIKNKVREIQDKYCGESVETKLYNAIKEGIKIGKKNCGHGLSLSINSDIFDDIGSQTTGSGKQGVKDE